MTPDQMIDLPQPAEGPIPGAGDTFRAGLDRAIEIVGGMKSGSTLNSVFVLDCVMDSLTRERDAHIGKPSPEIEELNLLQDPPTDVTPALHQQWLDGLKQNAELKAEVQFWKDCKNEATEQRDKARVELQQCRKAARTRH